MVDTELETHQQTFNTFYNFLVIGTVSIVVLLVMMCLTLVVGMGFFSALAAVIILSLVAGALHFVVKVLEGQ